MIICLSLHRLLVGIITYFVAGALIMKFHYQATGTDIIPNKSLWTQFPFLIKVYNDDNELESHFCCQFDPLFVASILRRMAVRVHLGHASVSFKKKSEVTKAIRKHNCSPIIHSEADSISGLVCNHMH